MAFLQVEDLTGLVVLTVIAGYEKLKKRKLIVVGVLILWLACRVLFLNMLLNQEDFSSRAVYYMLGNTLQRLREYFL